MVILTRRQIGACGELLVQQTLLKYGIDSARLTTDVGVDLVAYPSIEGKPVTIQVKTSSKLGHSFDNKYLRWQIKDECPADYIAAVDLSCNNYWLIPKGEFNKHSTVMDDGQRKLTLPAQGNKSMSSNLKYAALKPYIMDSVIPKIFSIK